MMTERSLDLFKELYTLFSELRTIIPQEAEETSREKGTESEASLADDKPRDVDRDELKKLIMSKDRTESMAFIKSKGYNKFSEIPDSALKELAVEIHKLKTVNDSNNGGNNYGN